MNKKISRNFALSLMICFIPFILSLVFYSQLPDQVAIHLNSSGEPDNYAPKLFMAVGIPLIMLGIHLYNWFRLESDPKKKNLSVILKYISKWIVPFGAVVMQSALISYALGYMLDWNFYVSLFIGVLFIIFGNYLPKCKQNYTVGIKLPWTLHDSDNWNKTHRMAGYLWISGGIVYIINAFIDINRLIFALMLILITLPIIYSYGIYRKNGNKDSTS